jgi:hypothetical protein
MNKARTALGGAGTTTAALGFGGEYDATPAIEANTEEWNGASWVEVADLNTARYYVTGSGTSTAALAALGKTTVPGGETGATEEWSGSSNTTKTVSTD